ncbi:hypothetical protein KQY27_05115 [Methanobrevibacter sp. TMH8]|uniref:hypothetical protein n=1 Tax=Methanobrevibacter sp. TMH8 TaxID=2848611 RepID=UPI001CCDD187|nr:hypothetical protein [Methanobrevibacter sp. TMH8]MBZ9570922.1 hypothetical protein [Methanobrevibacter sp. TMH8]
MDALEALAILILAGAIIVLLYYYMQNNADFMNKMNRVKDYVPSSVQTKTEEEQIPTGGYDMTENVDANSSTSMGEKLKVKFKDIDMPNLNTDVFSKRIDTFLDEKSDELIKDWELATKKDLSTLEKRCDTAYRNVDELSKRFNEYREYTNERLDSLDERIKKIEEDNE